MWQQPFCTFPSPSLFMYWVFTDILIFTSSWQLIPATFFFKLKFLRISHYFLPATFSSHKVHNLCNLGDHPTERFTDYLKSKRHLISAKKHNVTTFGNRKRIVWRFLYHLCHCFQVFNDVNYKWKIRSLGAISCCMKRIQV